MDCAYTNIELIDSINYLEKIIKIMKDVQTNSLKMDEVSKKYGPFLADRVSMISSLKKASIMLSALYISFLKEMIIDKHSNENMNLLIEQEAFDKVMDFTEIRDGKVYLGDTSYETSMRCLDVIRNKLLHGDYIFDGESIQFIHEGNKAILTYRLLSKLKDELSMIRHCKGRTISKKIYIVRDLITNTLEEIELKFKTRGSNKLTFDMAVMFEKILKEIQRNNYKISYNPDKCVNLAIDKVKHLKAYNKLDIKYGKKTINQEKEDELLKSTPKDKLKDKYLPVLHYFL